MHHRLVLLAAALTCVTTHAQEPGTQNERTIQPHDRHTHKHNPDMPAAHVPTRFMTSRTSPVELPLPGEDDAFFFVVYGDRTGGPDSGINVLKDAVRDTNLLEPDLVFTVGDMIDGYNETPEWTAEMLEFKGVMDELTMPWFPVAGNHDTYWRDRGGGEARPANQHDDNYELNFGPLWYAFEHKNCMFVSLYSDEGNPETGEKSIRRPDAQVMSDEQFAWLKSVLAAAADMEHVFVFLHHPRWLGGRYGDDWAKVHAELVKAGNVSAVFAGHIHRLRSDPSDGIEYVTLATVGGNQQKAVPQAGWLHHFNVVTVRPGRVALSALPVGEVMDVREITGAFADEMAELAAQDPGITPVLAFGPTGGVDAEMLVPVTNTTSRAAEFQISPMSLDSRWMFTPDHMHLDLAPGETVEAVFRVARMPGDLDSTLQPVAFAIDADVLMPGRRYAIPTIEAEPMIRFDPLGIPATADDRILSLNDDGHVTVPSQLASIDDGPFTLEAWFRADTLDGRTGLVAKTEGSEYGIFVSNGEPHFAVHLDGSYKTAEPDEFRLSVDTWHHIAGVFDGSEVRVYVDGVLRDRSPASGARTLNTLPLMIGADVDRRGNARSNFHGDIAEVRLSTTARYTGERFVPQRQLGVDSETAVMYDMDRAVGPWLVNEGTLGGVGRREGNTSLIVR
ncbi:MAG: LamG-like jellyroll fold domain-containing protein [Planctomycetota bacterium]